MTLYPDSGPKCEHGVSLMRHCIQCAFAQRPEQSPTPPAASAASRVDVLVRRIRVGRPDERQRLLTEAADMLEVLAKRCAALSRPAAPVKAALETARQCAAWALAGTIDVDVLETAISALIAQAVAEASKRAFRDGYNAGREGDHEIGAGLLARDPTGEP